MSAMRQTILKLATVQTAFGVKDIRDVAQDFNAVSLDSL